MKKGLIVLLILVLVVGAFFVGNGFDFKHSTDITTLNENTTGTNNIEVTTSQKEIDRPLTQKDYYLYKTIINEGKSVYTYRQDGQVSDFYNDERTVECDYDENGLLQYIRINGEYVQIQYEYLDGNYVGSGFYEDENALFRLTYDDNYRLFRTYIDDSSGQSYEEAIYDENNNIVKTIRHDGTTTVNKYNKKGVLLREEEYGNDNKLTSYAEYNDEGILKKTEKMIDGEVYEYSEVKKEGELYVEYVYSNDYSDAYYEKNNLPVGSYVLSDKVERKYNQYGNLIQIVMETDGTGYFVNYEYRLKDNVS